MDRGTYAAASGGLLQFRKLEIANNNIANASTPGFKRQMLVGKVQSFDATLAKALERKDPYARGDHERTPGAVHAQTVTDFSPGAIRYTGNALDVALRDSRDFFVIETPQGPQYTRAGNFTLSAEGQLVTMDGMPVQGDGGPITIDGGRASITSSGQVYADGDLVGTLQVVRFEDPKGLQRVGHTRFRLREDAEAPVPVAASLEPSSLEMSNVSAISSMIDLITANRAFEMYSKSSNTIDQMNQAAVSQVGRRN